jgi:hypothetical protein
MRMKTICLLVLLVPLLLTGCAGRYVMTLTNGNRITTKGKPKVNGDVYVFTDYKGHPGSVPTGRVREIAPASMASSPLSSGQ